MTIGLTHAAPFSKCLRASCRQLSHQVTPLVLELTVSHGNRPDTAHAADLARIECIAAGHRLIVHGAEIGRNRGARLAVRAESMELGMGPVAFRPPAEHGSCQQRLAPQGDETLRIEVARMDRPEPHAQSWSFFESV